MSQRINSIYRLVTVPIVYEMIQKLLGQKKSRAYLCEGPLKTQSGDRILDVGCGPATLRNFLGDVEYTGIDLNSAHIEKAQAEQGHRGTFICGDAVTNMDKVPGPYDFIVCVGLLHHLDDDEAKTLVSSLSERLSEKGRLVTYDPVFIDNQNIIAKTLKALDSGQNIRRAEEYAKLFSADGFKLTTEVLSGMLNVPYNHCCNIFARRVA